MKKMVRKQLKCSLAKLRQFCSIKESLSYRKTILFANIWAMKQEGFAHLNKLVYICSGTGGTVCNVSY